MRKPGLACVLLAACGVDAPEQTHIAPHDIGEHDGSRLHVEWYQTADGARVMRGIMDEGRGEECTFQATGDGYYCLPAVVSQPLSAYARGTLDHQGSGTSVEPWSWCTDDGFYAPGGFWDNIHDAPCTVVRDPAKGMLCRTDRGEAIGLIEEHDAGDRRIANVFALSIDGMRQHLPELFDIDTNAPCEVMLGADGVPRCLPEHVFDTTSGIDCATAQPATVAYAPEGATFATAIDRGSVLVLDSAITTVGQPPPAACVAIGEGHRVVATLPLSSFVTATAF